MTFDPSLHLMQFKGKDYLQVQWRLVWFREKFPHGCITTTEVCVDMEAGYARFRAEVTDGEGGSATGTGTEWRKNMLPQMVDDWLEKAETRAIGRALAALGIGTQFVGEELSEGEHVADAPSEHERLAIKPEDKRRREKGIHPNILDDGYTANAPAVPQAAPAGSPAGAGPASAPKAAATPEPKPALLDTQQLKEAINAEFKRLSDHYSTMALCQKGWGTAVDSIDKVRQLKDGSLRTGLKRLQAIRLESPPSDGEVAQNPPVADTLLSASGGIPDGEASAKHPPEAGGGVSPSPAASSASVNPLGHLPPGIRQEEIDALHAQEDVPTFPPPEGSQTPGLTLATLDESQGSLSAPRLNDHKKVIVMEGAEGDRTTVSQLGGKTQCSMVQEGTGIMCVREALHPGKHYFDPGRPEDRVVKLPARPLVVDGHISTSDTRILQRWCQQKGWPEIFASAVSTNPRNHYGEVLVEAEQWQSIQDAVNAMGPRRVPA
jgi:hypothetical protein